MDQQGSPCCHNFLTVIQSYHINMTIMDELHAEEIGEAIMLNVLKPHSQRPSWNVEKVAQIFEYLRVHN